MKFYPGRVITALVCGWLVSGCATETTTVPNEDWNTHERADVHAQLAAQYMERDMLTIALDELNKALSIDPEHSRTNYVMAVLQTRMNDFDEADRYYKRALKSNPRNSEAAHDYGIFLCEQGKVEEAMHYFQDALDNPLYTGSLLTSLRAGECLITVGNDPERAEQFFKAVLVLNPRVPLALYYMADIQYNNGELLSARGYIERFFSVNPETAESLLLAAKIESGLDADDVAQDYARRLRAKFPASDQVLELKEL